MDELDSIHQPANCPESRTQGSRPRTEGRDSIQSVQDIQSTVPEAHIIERRDTDENGQYTEATLKKHPLLTDAAQEVLKLGYLPRDVEPVITQILSNEDWSSLTKQNVVDKLRAKEQSHSINMRRANKEQRDTDGKMKEACLSEEEIRAENMVLRRELICQQCNGSVDVMFLPCCHVSGCFSCGTDRNECPFCHALYTEKIRVLRCDLSNCHFFYPQ